MGSPFFTIIIPSFNSGDKIQGALNSVLQQQFTDFEILVIDGLSGDGTVDILKENSQQDGRVRFISEKDNGIYDAMNKGIKLAKGEWIYFLGSDDRLYDNRVLTLVFDKLNEAPCDLLYGNIFSQRSNSLYGGAFTLDRLLRDNISHQAIFYNRKISTIVGEYNTKYRTHADWDFNIRCFSNNQIVTKYSPLTIALFAAGGVSSRHEVLFFREVLMPRKLRMLNAYGCRRLHAISLFDEWWRFIRNSRITNEEEANAYAKNETVPPCIKNMIAFQQKLPYRILETGIFSKFFMLMSYLHNSATGALKGNMS